MASNGREIADQIIVIMRTIAAFNTIEGYVIGVSYKPPIKERRRMCEIQLAFSDSEDAETGYIQHVYLGQAIFTVLEADALVFTDKVAVSESQEIVRDYIEAFIREFRKKARHNLGNPTLTSGGIVTECKVGNDAEYMPAERNDNYTAVGTVPFTVRVKEVQT